MKNHEHYKSETLILKITTFLREIGIPVEQQTLNIPTFLPGVYIAKGKLVYDLENLKYPGDLLHEAGHLACMQPETRQTQEGDLIADNDGNELGALLWSYAAANYLDIPLEIVFHSDGYKGDSTWLIKNYSSGNYIGLPLLQWMGMTAFENNDTDQAPFPHMIKWLR